MLRPVEVVERETAAAGTSLIVREYRPDRHTATVLLNGGFVPESMDDPRLVAFARAVAETGFLVLTPDYPAVRALEFTSSTTDQIADLLGQVRRSSAWGGSRPLAVIGLSYMGTLSLKAALRPECSPPPEFVGVLGGYADFGELMNQVFQDVYRGDGVEVPVDPYGRFLVLRSAVDYFEPPPAERDQIREIALALARQRDPAAIERSISRLSPAGRACVHALRAFSPARSPELWSTILTESRGLIEALSVREPAERLRSRLVIMHSVYDHVLPYAGSVALHRRFPSSTLVLTTLFTHVTLRLSPRGLAAHGRELRDLFRVFAALISLQCGR